jgi:hypothetical protein
MLCLTTFVYSQHTDGDFDTDKQAIELTINGDKITVQSLPQNGFVEVFNILGTKVTGFQVTAGTNSSRITLPKGYYILKSDNVTRKIVIK